MKFLPGAYRVALPAGTVKIIVTDTAAFETWLKSQQASVGRTTQGGDVGQYKQTLRPISGADGPWWVISQNPDGTDFNVTTTVANVGAALDQAKSDGATILAQASASPKNIDIFTTF